MSTDQRWGGWQPPLPLPLPGLFPASGTLAQVWLREVARHALAQPLLLLRLALEQVYRGEPSGQQPGEHEDRQSC